jgi:hypothetical protein
MSTTLTKGARRRKASVDRILVYMDGPQVITLKGSRNSYWMGVAVDIDGMDYPFFCSQVSSDELIRYFDGHVDLRYLFTYTKYKEYMVFDYAKYRGPETYMFPIDPIEDYLPEKGFFARDHTESVSHSETSLSPSQTSDDEYVVDIDGSWEFPEFSSFSEKMSGVYSFLYSLNTLSHHQSGQSGAKLSRLEETFSSHPWQGGFSYVHFYNDLYFSIPKVDRLNVKEIAYASPGHIALEGNKGTFSDVEVALLAMRKNYSKSKEYYGNLHRFLSRNKLLTASAETIRGSTSVQKVVEDSVVALAKSMSLKHVAIIYKYSEQNWIITAKIVLSYFRRLSELFRFYAEGRAK